MYGNRWGSIRQTCPTINLASIRSRRWHAGTSLSGFSWKMAVKLVSSSRSSVWHGGATTTQWWKCIRMMHRVWLLVRALTRKSYQSSFSHTLYSCCRQAANLTSTDGWWCPEGGQANSRLWDEYWSTSQHTARALAYCLLRTSERRCVCLAQTVERRVEMLHK